MALIVGQPTAAMPSWTLSRYEMCPIWEAGISNATLSKAGTVTGTAGFGSSLFLHRITLPARINLTEIEAMVGMAFNSSNDGQGTISRSMAVYSFGNSTSLATLCSTSGSSSWITGTATAGASTSITQFQQGWGSQLGISNTVIQPMTFASTSLAPGEYVVGQIFDFAQASSTWTVRLHAPLVTTINTNYTQWAALAASAFTSSNSMNALSTSALLGGSLFTASTSSAVSLFTAAPVAIALGKFGTSASLSVAAANSVMATATANSTATVWMNGSVAGASMLSSGGLLAGSFFTASGSGAVMSSGGLSAGSMITASAVLSGANALAANIQYYGTGDKATVYYGPFVWGMSSTGGIPASIAVNNVISATNNRPSPWFALVGS